MTYFLHLLFSLAVITIAPVDAQSLTLKEILAKSDQAVARFDQGQFTFHEKVTKISVGEDSSFRESSTTCFFKKNPSDSLLGYKIALFNKNGLEQIYDGTDLLTLLGWVKTLEVTHGTLHPKVIEQKKNDFSFMPLFVSVNRILQLLINAPSGPPLILSGPVVAAGENCYRIELIQAASSSDQSVLYYISATSFLPLRMVITMKTMAGKAQELSRFDYSIRNVTAKPISSDQFSRERLSAYSIERTYDPDEEAAKDTLLPIGYTAPDWTLPLVSGGRLQLKALRGKLVVMDFWYKACAPCQRQMIALQRLHDKFSPDDVVFVGVNTQDDPVKDKLLLFLKNRTITMSSVYRGKSIQARYNVQGSPALFILDGQGKVTYKQSGYSDTLLSDVEHVISAQLKK